MVPYQTFDIDYMLMLYSSEDITTLQKSFLSQTFLCDSNLYFVLKE